MEFLRRWWPALAWAVVISAFSTGAFTADNTSRIIIPILHWMLPHASPNTLSYLHHIIRKCGHFTEYFILSLLLLRGIRAGRREAHFRWALFVIIVVAAYACLDELHQSFVPGRTAAIGDVLIDTSGGVAAQLIAGLLAVWAHLRHQRRETATIPPPNSR
ncbi:MAG: VanZ family protein [Candidatus Acidiferrales bacterium]